VLLYILRHLAWCRAMYSGKAVRSSPRKALPVNDVRWWPPL
jgi:hypothetical protein